MPTYKYDARNAAGKLVQGVVEATSEKQAISLVRGRKLFLTHIAEKTKKQNLSITRFLKRVSFSEIVTFTRQLSAMVTAGLQLPQVLTILRTQTTNPLFSDILGKIMREVEAGGSLGKALEKFPQLFSPTYISLVKAGESSGNLDKVLERLADKLERDREFKGKVKSAMVYPVIILIAMAVVVAALMIFVIPQLSDLYDDFALELPLQTQILIALSDFLVNFWWLALLGIFAGITGINKFKKTPAGKRLFDTIGLRLPIFGKLTKQVLLVEFTGTLGLLVGAGIHLLDALSILTDSMGNVLFRESLEDVAKKVEKGLPMGIAFAQHETFPPILSQMIKVGEETGTLDDSLTRLSKYFENESNQTVKGLTTAIEPIIMVILGISVGFIVFSIITPIYNLTTQF